MFTGNFDRLRIDVLRVLCFAAGIAFANFGIARAQTSDLKHATHPAALVWSDEFNGPAKSQPDPTNWTYDVGNSGWGNQELEIYCAWASNAAPCSSTTPSAYIGGDGYLHIVARDLGKGVYTSARLKTQGLKASSTDVSRPASRSPKGRESGPSSGCSATTSPPSTGPPAAKSTSWKISARSLQPSTALSTHPEATSLSLFRSPTIKSSRRHFTPTASPGRLNSCSSTSTAQQIFTPHIPRPLP